MFVMGVGLLFGRALAGRQLHVVRDALDGAHRNEDARARPRLRQQGPQRLQRHRNDGEPNGATESQPAHCALYHGSRRSAIRRSAGHLEPGVAECRSLPKSMQPLVRQLLSGLLACSGIAPGAVAAPNEIKIFTDELAAYGEHTLETHVNKASRAGPRLSGARTPLQVMPEYSYGVRENWELSLQLPVSISQTGSRLEGYRAEFQYVAPHDDDDGFYWGVNFELARIERAGESSYADFELIPILGYRKDRWHFVANPGIEKAISGASGTVNFQPAAKLAYGFEHKNYFGFEYFADVGPLRHRSARADQSRVLYVAWDGKIGKSDINVGVGRGLTDSSDRWVLKMIYEFAF